jgi:hypothetical protein
MKRFFIGFLRTAFLVAFMHGQLAFAITGVPALMDSGCSRHVDASVNFLHHGQHQTGSDANTP